MSDETEKPMKVWEGVEEEYAQLISRIFAPTLYKILCTKPFDANEDLSAARERLKKQIEEDKQT